MTCHMQTKASQRACFYHYKVKNTKSGEVKEVFDVGRKLYEEWNGEKGRK